MKNKQMNNRLSLKKLYLPACFLAMAQIAPAKVQLPNFITDSMVVQQQSSLTIEGKASHNVKITASWNGKPTHAKLDKNGNFSVSLATPPAGGPYTITFDDNGDRTILRDIYSGEVWLCSGQSNMEMPVGGWGCVMNYKEEIANAKYDNIRFLQVAKQTGFAPAKNTNVNMGGWRTCSPSTVENFSYIAYFYAR